ncbi:MAG: hypothetical protein AVO33_07040 [delta proteobacterium ML8_F1]|nr:MAG: hypothetical protein AVO33_07040 [delta proteobacterium ML8_F1]
MTSQEFAKEEYLETLGALVAIKSNYFHEEAIMAYVYERLRARGIDAVMHEYEDAQVTGFKGKNVIGRMGNPEKGPKILLNAHLDTVNPLKSWTYPPYELTVEGDRAYGMGSCDMKSGAAALILAVEGLHERAKDLQGEIIFSFVSDEEGPFGLGTNYLIHENLINDADIAIVTEPSAAFTRIPFPNVCIGARGGTSYRVDFHGRAAHGAHPHLGISAIKDAARVVNALDQIVLPSDGILGRGDQCVINIQGGGDACSVAEHAFIEVFRHMVTGETKESVYQEIDSLIKSLNLECGYEITFRKGPTEGSDIFLPYVSDKENPLMKAFGEVVAEVTSREANYGYFDSIGDFNYLGSRINQPVVVFGPEGGNFHSGDEWVDIPSALKTTEVVYRYLEKMLL